MPVAASKGAWFCLRVLNILMLAGKASGFEAFPHSLGAASFDKLADPAQNITVLRVSSFFLVTGACGSGRCGSIKEPIHGRDNLADSTRKGARRPAPLAGTLASARRGRWRAHRVFPKAALSKSWRTGVRRQLWPRTPLPFRPKFRQRNYGLTRPAKGTIAQAQARLSTVCILDSLTLAPTPCS
jgi:hypothetical protein